MYIRGQLCGIAKKLKVVVAYNKAMFRAQRKGRSLSINAVAKICYVRCQFVNKVGNRLVVHGRVLLPLELTAARNVPRGAGSKTSNRFDWFVLLQLRQEEPSWTRSSYINYLYEYTGNVASKSTIPWFFFDAFPFKGPFVKLNIVPYLWQVLPKKWRKSKRFNIFVLFLLLPPCTPEAVEQPHAESWNISTQRNLQWATQKWK